MWTWLDWDEHNWKTSTGCLSPSSHSPNPETQALPICIRKGFHPSCMRAIDSLAAHPMKRAWVAPVKPARHMGHWRNCEDCWHFWHTVWPQGIKATKWPSSWQMGQLPFMPFGALPVLSGTAVSMLHVARMVALLSQDPCFLYASIWALASLKPSWPSLWFKSSTASPWAFEGRSFFISATNSPWSAISWHNDINCCRVSSTHWSRQAAFTVQAFCASCCPKDIWQKSVGRSAEGSLRAEALIPNACTNPICLWQLFDNSAAESSFPNSIWRWQRTVDSFHSVQGGGTQSFIYVAPHPCGVQKNVKCVQMMNESIYDSKVLGVHVRVPANFCMLFCHCGLHRSPQEC